MRTATPRSLRNLAASGLALALLAGTFLTPASAHYAGEPDAHVFNTHVKPLADARYDRLRSGGHIRTNLSTNASASSFSNLSDAPFTLGGFAFTVPAGQSQFVVAEYTAESTCFGGPAAGHWCAIDVLVDGVNIGPSGFAFDSTENGTAVADAWHSLTLRRVSEALSSGPHTIDFIAYVTDAGVTFRLDDITASIDRYRA